MDSIYLRVITDAQGRAKLVDQDGRVVRGVQQLSLETSYGDVNTFTLHAQCMGADGKPYTNKIAKEVAHG